MFVAMWAHVVPCLHGLLYQRRILPHKIASEKEGRFDILLLQGVVEIVRCVICLQTGEWPSREEDVEEVDVDKLKEMVHVKDSDIEALDAYVTRKGAAQ